MIAERIYHDGILEKGSLPDPMEFKSEIFKRLSDVPTEKSTLDYYDDYLAWLAARKKSKSFIAAMTGLKKILTELKSKATSIRFKNIDLNFETKFRQLMEQKGYKKNTVSSKIKRLRLFLGWAFRNNLHQNQAYKQFEMKEHPVAIIALTEAEIGTIAKLSIPAHKHVKLGGTSLIRDWFLISCECGLRYSDFHKIAKPELIKVDGGFDVKVKTQKTGVEVVIPVSQILYTIFEKYKFSVPAVPSNQKYNAGLRRVADLAELNKEISSHTGRKSFCTNMQKRGVPISFIMKVSGHKTEKEFFKYIGTDGAQNAALIRERMTEQFTVKPKMVVSK